MFLFIFVQTVPKILKVDKKCYGQKWSILDGQKMDTTINNIVDYSPPLRSFSSSDEGSYTCSGSMNSVSTTSNSVSLALLEMTFSTTTVYLSSGSSVTLTCSADAPSQLNYLPTIAWSTG